MSVIFKVASEWPETWKNEVGGGETTNKILTLCIYVNVIAHSDWVNAGNRRSIPPPPFQCETLGNSCEISRVLGDGLQNGCHASQCDNCSITLSTEFKWKQSVTSQEGRKILVRQKPKMNALLFFTNLWIWFANYFFRRTATPSGIYAGQMPLW